MNFFKPFMYMAFFAGMFACGGHSTKQPGTTSVKPSEATSVNPASRQTSDTVATYTWLTEACEYTANYNPQQYSPEQLKNTFALWFSLSGTQLENNQMVFRPEDIKKLNLQLLIDEYKKKKDQYRHMQIVNIPYWHTMKEQRMRELDDQYELARLYIQAYTDPSVLANNRFSQACRQYVVVLTSKDTAVLFTAWKTLVEEQKAKNGSPDSYMQRFYEEYNSPEKLSYAMMDLISFGWYNCANETLTHSMRDEKMETEYNKLFTNVKIECEGP